MAHAKLSSFGDLAEKVITDLGATKESKARKLFSKFMELNKDPHTRGVMSADHIFSGLIRSFDRNDINCSVARSLLPNGNPDLTAHKIILKLARSQGGQTRLITTNFDLLFESSNSRLTSVTRASLPRIEFSDNDWGIVHLHGKVNKDYSGPDNDGFVLSSSEFGDAYLAQGWARNFVKDVLGKFVAVFVGYSADDPPIRYLLEGLQQSDGANHKIYAFQNADDEAIAQWDEKGVKPIVYNLDQNDTHTPLWDSLDAWGNRTRNPDAWAKRVLSKARKGPTKLKPHERGMIVHLVKSPWGARAFEQATPPLPAEWLCVLDSSIRLQQVEEKGYLNPNEEVINPYQMYGIDNDPPPSDRNELFSQGTKSDVWDAFDLSEKDIDDLGGVNFPEFRSIRSNHPARLPLRLSYIASWISKVAEQRITVWWAGRQPSLHPDLIRNVELELTKIKDRIIPKPILEAWNIIFELSSFYGRKEYQVYDLKDRIKLFGWSNFVVREHAKISAPILKRNLLYTNSIPRDNRRSLKKYSLVKVDVDYPNTVFDIKVPDEYLQKIVNAHRTNLELAIDMEVYFSLWVDEICAIEPDDTSSCGDIDRGHGLSCYVLNFVELFRRLLNLDVVQAKREFNKWRREDLVFDRLRIWACGLEGLVNEAEFTSEVMLLSDDDFWALKGQRDLLISIKNKWSELSENNRKLIEKRILKGPRKPRWVSREDHVVRSAYRLLNRLHWLNSQGCIFSFDLDIVTNRYRAKAPDWKPEYAESAAESRESRVGWVRTDTDWSDLKGIPPSKIIENANKKRNTSFRDFTEYKPFLGLCDDWPLRAITALSIELKKGKFHAELWRDYLSRETRKKDKYRLKLLTAGRITQVPNTDFKDIILTASRWYKDYGPELRDMSPKIFEAVWEKFISTIKEDKNAIGSALVRQENKEIDWTGEAINSASGHLAQLHMTSPATEHLQRGQGYPKLWLKKAEQLLCLPNDAHRYAMVIFAHNLSWFYEIDPEWTDRNLINVIESDKTSSDDKAAIWAGFMWGATVPNAELYIKLKPHMLEMANQSASGKRRHAEVLSGLLLSGWGSKNKENLQYVSDEELRNVLLVAGDDFRSYILWHLGRWSKDKKSKWDKKVLHFLQRVWPKHKKVRTSKTSARLCEIALTQKENFPAVSKQVSQLVSKVGMEYVHIPRIQEMAGDQEEGDNLASKYPEDYLNLLYSILPDQIERWPYGAAKVLKHIERISPKLSNDPKLIELKSRLNDN